MPIFEYRCHDCKTTFEKLIFPSEKEEGIACPKCGSKQLERLLSNFGFRMASGSTMSAGAEANCGSSCASKKCSSCKH